MKTQPTTCTWVEANDTDMPALTSDNNCAAKLARTYKVCDVPRPNWSDE